MGDSIHKILLIEDNTGDVELVREMLELEEGLRIGD